MLISQPHNSQHTKKSRNLDSCGILYFQLYPKGLTLGELGSLTGFLETVLTALFLTRITRNETSLLQSRTEFSVKLHECTRNAMTDRASLARCTATRYVCDYIIFINSFR